MKREKIIPRGIRNNNPLNIRIGNTWLGERTNPTDPSFEQFVTMEYGLRAGFVLLRRYIRHYHRTTIREIIAAWAPANENDTQGYALTVASMIRRELDEHLRYEDEETMVQLVGAMCHIECGEKVSEVLIRRGYHMA